MKSVARLAVVVLALIQLVRGAEIPPTVRIEVEELTSTQLHLVDDPAASGGKAKVGKAMLYDPATVPWSPVRMGFVSPYINPITPGSYKLKLRMKINDNSSSGDVLMVKANAAKAAFKGGDFGGVYYVKGSDFTANGAYQIFEFDVETYSGEGIVYFLSYHQAAVDITFDYMELVPVQIYTDDEILAKRNFTKPDPLTKTWNENLDILIVRGPLSKRYDLENLAAQFTNANVVVTKNSFNIDYTELMQYDVIVLGDMTLAEASQREMLKDFVEKGGGLFILGGVFSLGRGGRLKDSNLDPVLPVNLVGKTEFKKRTINVKAVGSSPILNGLDQGSLSSQYLYYHHELTAKAGSTLVLESDSDGYPLLVAGTYGAGKVAVFCGSVCGVENGTLPPLWKWNGWQLLMANTIDWLKGE